MSESRVAGLHVTFKCPRCNYSSSRGIDFRSHLEDVEQMSRDESEAALHDAWRDGTRWELRRQWPRMADWTYNTLPKDKYSEAALAAVDQWFQSNKRNLYLHGPVGTGKTALAWCLLRGDVLEALPFYPVALVNVRELLRDMRAGYTTKDTTDHLEELREASWLVLDDLGAERPTAWATETIASLVEARYESDERWTIVTSNYSPSELIARLGHEDPIIGQRIVSRLLESCSVVRVDGPDRRISATQRAA